MAKISTYPILSDPTINDILIGTDVQDLNITKNFSIGSIIDIIGNEFVPYVGATGNVNLGAFNITSSSFIVAGGLSSQFLKANGTLDSTVYVPATRTITINSVGYDLSANRSWDLNTIDSLTTIGTSGAATYIGKTLNIPQYQAQGSYITQLNGEATAVGPGNATVTLSNLAVISKVLTGLNITGGTVTDTDSILTAFGKVQNQINGLAGGVTYEGTWNAATNTPTLTSSVGVQGHYYVVSVAGNTNLNGITDWQLGDWAIFNGSTWQKVDNTDAVVSVNGYTGAVVLTFSDVGAPPATRTLTINGVGYDLSADRSWTVGDVRTDQTYSNPTWISSLAWGKITGTPTTLAGYGITDGALNTTTLTINGTTFNLSANRTWNVGTVTSVGTSGPLTGGTITGSGTIGITQAGASSDGYLSSTDWNTFNNKQNALTNPVTGTGTIFTLPMWSGATSLVDSPLSYGPDTFNFQYNSATGGTVNFTNIGLTAYTYSIQMNNFGSPRSTVHSYTDGVVAQSIGGTQVSRVFANGNTIIGAGAADNGYKLEVSGNLYVNSIVNATTDTDRFIVSDGGIIKYRTGAELLSDIGGQSSLTLTTTGTTGPATLIGSTLNIPQYQGGVTSFNTRTGAVTLTSSDVTTALGYTPVTDLRTLTINGETYNLTANRSWTIGVNPSAREVQTYIATASQTTFTVTGGYTVGLLDVFINGVRLTSSDFTATNGTTVVLAVGTMAGNIVDIIKYTSGFTNAVSGSGTTNELAYFTGSTVIASLSTATYPSLTELSYVKGVTSSIQTQLNGKQASGNYVTLDTTQTITSQKTFTTSGSSETMIISHGSGSGIALDISKGGNGEGLRVTKTSGSGNAMTVIGGNFEAPTIVKTGGTSTQYLMANGSVSTLTNPVTGTGTTNYLPKFTGSTTIGNSLVFDNGTNVGIGNATPNRKFLVQEAGTSTSGNVIGVRNDNSTSGAYINFIAGGGNAPSIGAKGNDITFTADGYGGTELLRVTGTGNVGIGTASPEGKLTVEGTSAQPPTSGTTANSLLQLKGSLGNELNIGSNTVAGNYGAYIQASDNNLAVPYQLNLQPNGGNVIIGGYTDAGFKLDVNGTGRFSDGTQGLIIRAYTGTDGWGAIYPVGVTPTTTNYSFIAKSTNVVLNASTSVTLAVSDSGKLTANSTGISVTGAATFSSSVTAQQNNISADGAGVVLQGYIDNNLRIAVRGSGYNSGARGGLFASIGDFSSSITTYANEGLIIRPTSGASYISYRIDTTSYSLIGVAGATSDIITGSALGDLNIRATNSQKILFSTNNGGSAAMTITSGGNVLIGTTTDTGARVRVAGNLTSATLLVRNESNTQSIIGIGNKSWWTGGASDNDAAIGTYSPNMCFFTNNSGTERMRITSEGAFKASNSGDYANSTAAYHELRQGLTNTNIALFTHIGASPYGPEIGFSSSPNNSTNYFLICKAAGASMFIVYSNGNVVNQNGSYGAISDIKLKENITDASPKLNDLLKVKVRNYNLIGEDTKQIGVIAQELEEIFPGLIDSSIDKDKDGNYLGTTTKSVKYSVFVPMLIKEIQELKSELDELKGNN